MQESAGNEYQNKSIDNIAISVYATQLGGELNGVSGENDSFNGWQVIEFGKDGQVKWHLDSPDRYGSISGIDVLED